MRGIELLKSEHENIRYATKCMKQECIDILEGKEINVEWFKNMIQFCRNYADHHHHGKEEKILFRIMVEELGSAAEKLVQNGMLVEHDMGRFHIGELEKAIEAYEKDPSTANKLDIITNASEYASLLNRHMDKEDTVVYTFAERNLNDELKAKVEEETKNLEKIQDDSMAFKMLEWLNQ